LSLIIKNSSITTVTLAQVLGISVKGVEWHMKRLRETGIIKRVGPDKGGYWEVHR